MGCPAILPGDAFLGGVLAYVDCQARTIGAAGYQTLSMPGSAVSLMLGVVLTIFIALFGYRLLLGHVPDMRDAVISVVRIGVVLVLATSWPAFRTLAYDVTMSAPAELATGIGGGAALPGAMPSRLQRVDNGLVELIELGTGSPFHAATAALPKDGQQAARLARRAPYDPVKEASRVSSARTIYLTSTIAAFASVRLVAGLLLALGPLFALFLLFDSTRGLFEGWIRGLAGAALGALSTAIILGVQLALMEPWLASVLFQRRQEIATPGVPVELLVMTLVFAVTLLAALIATARVAQGFHFPPAWRALPARLIEKARSAATAPAPIANPSGLIAAEQQSRAGQIAVAVAATQRRETRATSNNTAAGSSRASGIFDAVSRAAPTTTATPLGQSYRRRTKGRVSARAARRDRKS